MRGREAGGGAAPPEATRCPAGEQTALPGVSPGQQTHRTGWTPAEASGAALPNPAPLASAPPVCRSPVCAPRWVCVPPCNPNTPSRHAHIHTPLPVSPHVLVLTLRVGGAFLQDAQLPVASWPRAGLGTHLEVPVDDPHLMAVQNRLQDLLDTVTAANSRRVSEGGHERQGWGMGCYVALGSQESRVKVPPTAQGRRCQLEGGPLWPAQGRASPHAPPSPLTRPTAAVLRGHTPVPPAQAAQA